MDWEYQVQLFQNGNGEFPILKDTTPDITTPRLYGTWHTPKNIQKAPISNKVAFMGDFLFQSSFLKLFNSFNRIHNTHFCNRMQRNCSCK